VTYELLANSETGIAVRGACPLYMPRVEHKPEINVPGAGLSTNSETGKGAKESLSGPTGGTLLTLTLTQRGV